MKAHTSLVVKNLKDSGEDFEWYPTTKEIIDVVKQDISGERFCNFESVLDCGAGDGRVLMELPFREKYAIEKAQTFIAAMDKSIFIVGTDFTQQTLIDKGVDVVFSNPPYSEFSQWAVKIINEANARFIYLVLPSRWKLDTEIDAAVKRRNADSSTLGSFDFLNADRSARAKVDVVKICLRGKGNDAFDNWFDSTFRFDIQNTAESKFESFRRSRDSVKSKTSELVIGSDLVEVLQELYHKELENLFAMYRSLETLDSSIMFELGVSLSSVKGGLRSRIEGLKDAYWNELFDKLAAVTNRLTTANRKKLLDRLFKHVHVDFSTENARAIIVWVIKNANGYLNEQLTDIVKLMAEYANVKNYKSNERLYTENEWRYRYSDEHPTHFMLELRLVLERCGGVTTSNWAYEREKFGGLTEGACDFINDLLTVANNIGFDTSNEPRAERKSWSSGKRHTFGFRNIHTGKNETLMEVKAFKNQNLHIKMDQSFILKLNVEFGRLMGWIGSPSEASDEMGYEYMDVCNAFGSYVKIVNDGSNILRLCN